MEITESENATMGYSSVERAVAAGACAAQLEGLGLGPAYPFFGACALRGSVSHGVWPRQPAYVLYVAS